MKYSDQGRISFGFEIEIDEALARGYTTMHRLEVLRDVGGPLEICIDSETFFSEPYIPLLELGTCLQQWTNTVMASTIEDFVYESMEHDKPLLEFHRQVDGTWLVYSIWQQFESCTRFSIEELLDTTTEFIARVKDQVCRVYGIEFDKYVL